jgi:hypothetical protein
MVVAAQQDIYQDFADFIAGLSPEKLLEYKASSQMQARVEYLVAQKKNNQITAEELIELDKYFMFEHIVRLAKARALKLLKQRKAA